jgi:hypothetical protein
MACNNFIIPYGAATSQVKQVGLTLYALRLQSRKPRNSLWSAHADARPHITARTRWARARELSGLAHAPIVAALPHALVAAGKRANAELALTAATSRPVRGTRRAATVGRVGFLVGALVAVAVQWAIAGSRMGACTASAIAAPCMRRRGESKRGGGADEHAP